MSHRLAADLDDAAGAGDQAVAGEPRPAKLDAPGHALMVDDGAVAGGRGKFGDADVVAVIEGRGARARVIKGLSGRRGREGAEELIGGSRVVGESVQVVGRHVERPGGRGELVERPAGLDASGGSGFAASGCQRSKWVNTMDTRATSALCAWVRTKTAIFGRGYRSTTC